MRTLKTLATAGLLAMLSPSVDAKNNDRNALTSATAAPGCIAFAPTPESLSLSSSISTTTTNSRALEYCVKLQNEKTSLNFFTAETKNGNGQKGPFSDTFDYLILQSWLPYERGILWSASGAMNQMPQSIGFFLNGTRVGKAQPQEITPGKPLSPESGAVSYMAHSIAFGTDVLGIERTGTYNFVFRLCEKKNQCRNFDVEYNAQPFVHRAFLCKRSNGDVVLDTEALFFEKASEKASGSSIRMGNIPLEDAVLTTNNAWVFGTGRMEKATYDAAFGTGAVADIVVQLPSAEAGGQFYLPSRNDLASCANQPNTE